MFRSVLHFLPCRLIHSCPPSRFPRKFSNRYLVEEIDSEDVTEGLTDQNLEIPVTSIHISQNILRQRSRNFRIQEELRGDPESRSHALEDIRRVWNQSVESEVEVLPEGQKPNWFIDVAFNAPLAKSIWQEGKKVPRWLSSQRIAELRANGDVEVDQEIIEETNLDLPISIKEIVAVLISEMASNIVVMDMKDKCDHMENMIIAEGRSKKQIYSMAHSVRIASRGRLPQRDTSIPVTLEIEGENTDDWMMLDLGGTVIHCFTPEARARYDIDGLWMNVAMEEQVPERIDSVDISSLEMYLFSPRANKNRMPYDQ
ncbi:Mitochondrial assembly of ribosomal large subunit protein 1 [Nowakowskiella sp. JEL0078]|nr:Mitochondrial assembly of ribosomal large subunit protein 1 [Nowakowskiella sp. JEL0078]